MQAGQALRLPELGGMSVRSLGSWLNPPAQIDWVLVRYTLRSAALLMLAVAAYKWLAIPRGQMEADVVVVGYERVKVPAGEFDAFKLTARERMSGTSPIGSRIDAETVRTYWYAPAARTIVKRESKNPYLGPSTVELVAFELQP
mgnify:CR=1 FL=1